jgi:hypothetical protein
MALDKITSTSTILLFASNLYANGRIIVFSDGSTKLIREPIEYEVSEPDDYIVIKHGDRLTELANRFYKDKVLLPSHHYWIIADANRTIIRNPLDISHLVGKQIVIPNILNFKLKD